MVAELLVTNEALLSQSAPLQSLDPSARSPMAKTTIIRFPNIV